MDLKDYDNIKVPKNLNEYIDKGIEKGSNYKKLHKNNTRTKVASILIASTVTLISFSNIPVVAKELIKIPIIGEVVKVLDFTNSSQFGGVITDGNNMIIDSLREDTINVYFSKDGEFEKNMPHYEIEYREYPYTIVLTFDGVRDKYDTFIETKVKKLPQVKDVYNIITLDDSRYSVAIEFEKNIDFKVTEHKNPAMLQIKLDNKKEIIQKTAYFIRTKEFDFGEELAIEEESLRDYKNTEIQKVKNGKYIIQFGPYENKEVAEELLGKLNNDENINLDFYLENREIGKGPNLLKSLF